MYRQLLETRTHLAKSLRSKYEAIRLASSGISIGCLEGMVWVGTCSEVSRGSTANERLR